MAQGFLQSFDSSLEICSAGTEPAAGINEKAVAVMKEAGIDISDHKPESVAKYLDETWDYVITVCDEANETCPLFSGKVINRLHMGFEDPSKVAGSEQYVMSEFRKVRDRISKEFLKFYEENLKI